MKDSQIELPISLSRGGARAGAGRPRLHSSGVAHVARERVISRTPAHVNFKYRCCVRSNETMPIFYKGIENARRHGLRIIHFAFQPNHVHLIIEADSTEILSRSMRSFTITLAMGFRKGNIQIERYHLHVLKTLRETENALRYVLINEQRHSRKRSVVANQFSSLSGCTHDFARQLVKTEKLSLIWKPVTYKTDRAKSWLLKSAHLRLIGLN